METGPSADFADFTDWKNHRPGQVSLDLAGSLDTAKLAQWLRLQSEYGLFRLTPEVMANSD